MWRLFYLKNQTEKLRIIQKPKDIMLRFYIAFAKAVDVYNKKNLSALVYSIQQHILLHIYEPISLTSLAEQFHMSGSYLSRKFSKECGKGIQTYINECKVEEAKLLIYYKKNDYAKIASLLGFTDQNHFIKVFKKYTGVLPSEFKKKGYNG